MWQWVGAGGGAGLGVFGLGYLLGLWRCRRHANAPDRTYRIVVIDETERAAGPPAGATADPSSAESTPPPRGRPT